MIHDSILGTGECYLGAFLFEGISEGCDDDWLASP